MVIAVLLLYSGIDMIGDMPSRVIPGIEPQAVEKVIPEEEKVECVKPEKKVIRVKKVESPETKVDTKPEVDDTKVDTKSEESDTNTGTETSTNPEEVMIPFPENDKLEPGEKEVEAKDDSEVGYKYYVYRSHGCSPCEWLVKELQKNVDEKDLILSYERTTKSGKRVTYVPVLEVYKDGELVHQQVGYTKWETIKRKLGETD